jgi:hypothetical protein
VVIRQDVAVPIDDESTAGPLPRPFEIPPLRIEILAAPLP